MRAPKKKNVILSRSISTLLAAGILSVPVAIVKATSDVWDGSTNGLWATNTNWLTNPAIVPGTGDTATFSGTGNGFTTIDLGAGITISGLLFDTAAAASYTIGAGAAGSQTLTWDNGGAVVVSAPVTTSQTVNANLVMGNDGSTQSFSVVNQSVAANQLLTLAGGITGSAGAGIKTLGVAGLGNVLISGVIGDGTGGTVALSKTNTGTLTLSGVNTYTGGTTLGAGTLNVNNAGALGNTAAGALTVTGGTLNNTSGAAITTTAAKTINLNGDLTVTGTSDLNFNGGGLVLGGTAGTRTLAVNAGTFSVGTLTGAAGVNISKTGAGNLFLTSLTNNASTIPGILDIQGGKVQAQADVTVGGLTGSGIFENGGAASKWLFVNNATDNTFSGTIRGNPANAAVRYGLVKRGVGTLNLTGTNSFIDNFAIENGTVRLTGVNTVGIDGTNGTAQPGTVANQNGILVIDGGTLNANRNAAPSVNVGGGASTRGFLKMTSGTITATSELWVSNNLSSFGELTMSGGTLNVGNWLALGRSGPGVGNISGGVVNVTTQNFTTGSFGGAFGVLNLSGGVVNVTSTAANQGGYLVAEGGNAILNVSGTGALNISGARGLNFAAGAGTGIANLNGGTVTTPLVQKGGGTGILNFNGGTLKPSVSSPAFMQGLTNAIIYGGGATFDTNGNSITVGQALNAPTDSGVSSIPVASGGAGYVDSPLVTLAGGSGTGATAVANVSNGVVTGFTITSPGSGYLPADVLTATLIGGGATTPATPGSIVLAPNSGGGLTKTGTGTLTLTGPNAYSGATLVNAGTLQIDATGTLASSGITVNGIGAKLVQTASSPLTAPVTLTNGAVDGTGVVSSVTVGDGTGGVIMNGNGTFGTLSITSLTFNGAGALNLTTAALTPELLTVGTLVTGAVNAAGKVTINATNSNSIWSNGVYNLVSYSTLSGAGFGGFVKGTIAGLGARQNATLTNPAGFIALAIGGDLPVWTGLLNGNWTTNTLALPKNWKLQSAGTPTDFINNDTVVFNDTATGSTALNISDANVNTTSVTFDNSTLNYSVASSGVFGIASGFLIKNGTGSLTMGTTNSYAGGTTLNNGTLNINNAAALGTGAFTINGGAIDNTSGSAVVSTTNNVQAWNTDVAFIGTKSLNLGTGAVPLPANRMITTGGTATLTVGGVISGTGFGVTKAGTGTLLLSGANTYTGVTDVTGGTLRLTGTINAGNATNLGQVTVSDLGVDNSIMEVAGGTINATKPAAPSILVGNISGGSGTLRFTSGTINSTGEMWVGGAAGSYGALTMSGGTATVGNWLAVGRDGSGVVNLSGGSLSVTGANVTTGSFGDGTGVLNLSGGTMSTTSVVAGQGNVLVGEGGSGTLNMSGTAVLNVSGALGVQIATTGSGVVNLLGGTINTPMVDRGTGTGTFNFNGGTLRATAASTTFMAGLTNAYVYGGGGTIDTNGKDITIAQPLLAPTGSGLTSTGLVVAGTGFIDTPLVVVTGGGTGATAVANVDATGNLTGITITNPGVDYTSDAIFNLIGGGGTGTIAGSPVLATNVSGGLTKIGTGTLTLSGASTYTGATNVNAGTLRVANTTGSATGTGALNVATGATLTGGGIVAGTVNLASGGTLSPGDGGVGTITVGGLTLGAGSILSYEWDFAQNNDRIIVTGNNGLTINGGKLNLYNAGGTTIFSSNGVYNLIGFTGTIAGNPTNLTIDPASTTVGKSYTFGSSGGFVTLVIGPSGVTPNFWNVNSDGNWATASNWTLNAAPNSAQAFANFGGGGTPITAPRTVTLNANQTVGSIGFNSAQPFTIAGANTLTLNNGTDPATIAVTGGRHTLGVAMNAVSSNVQFNVTNAADSLAVSGPLSGTAGVTKIGAGLVTFSGANTYTGTTTLNSGTLALAGAGTLGNAANPVAVAGGTLDLGTTTQTVGPVTLTGGSIVGGTLVPGSITANSAANLTISSAIGGVGTLTKTGTGTLTLNGNNTYTGGTILNGGTLSIDSNTALGANSGPVTFGNGNLSVPGTNATTLGTHPLTGFPAVIDIGDINNTFTIPQSFNSTIAFVKRGLGTLTLSGVNTFAATLAVNAGSLNISGGSVTETAAGNVPVQIANEAGASATMTVSGNAVLNTGTSELYVGQGFNTANGVFNLQDSGTVSVNNWVAVGRSNATGTVNMSGGTFNKLGGNGTHFTIGSNTVASTGTFNQSGGVINSADSDFFLGESGNGTYNVSGTAQANVQVLRIGANANSVGTLNFNGGTITATQITTGAGSGTVNLNGGTFRAATSNADFVTTSVAATVQAGGVIFDTNGSNVTVNGFLSHDFALDVTPDGGLTKRGAGVLTLTSMNSYTGQTVVEAGTLSVVGGISGSTKIAVRSGATLDASLAGGLFLNSTQTLGGSGSVLGNVNADTGAKLAPGDTAGTLTMGGNVDITLAVAPNNSGALLFELGLTSDKVALTTGTLTIGTGVLGFNDFVFSALAGLTAGTYTLFDTSNSLTGSLDATNLNGSLGGGFTGTLALGDNGHDIVLTVVPEPTTGMALLAGLCSIAGFRRLRRRS